MYRLLPIYLILCTTLSAAEPPDFNADVLPVFRKYCLGCHNAKEAEGGLILEDHARTLKGSEEHAVIVAGKSGESKLWLVLTGKAEPQMPPKENPAPKANELAVIQAWIDAGAKAPTKGPAGLVTPKIAPKGKVREPITAIAADPKGNWLAIARPANVEIVSLKDRQPLKQLEGHAGASWEMAVIQDIDTGNPLSFSFVNSPYNYYPTSIGNWVPNLVTRPPNIGFQVGTDFGPARFNQALIYPVVNVNDFTYPAPFTPGNAGRNIVTGRGLLWTASSFKKNFPIKERFKLQVRCDWQNPFHHFAMNPPTTQVDFKNPNLFGKYTADQLTSTIGGQPIINLQLRLSW